MRQHKFTKGSTQISYWDEATSYAGGVAWSAGSTNASTGQFKVESFHRFQNVNTGNVLPPYSTIENPNGVPVFCVQSNGYCVLQADISGFISVNAPAEQNKPTHYVSPQGSGNVTVTASVSPDWMDPSIISWAGGIGASSSTRFVARNTPGNTTITASIGSTTVGTALVHVLDATAAPAAAVNAPKTWESGGTATVPSNFGLTIFGGGIQGVTIPEYDVDTHVEGNKWVFRLKNVKHKYKMGINSHGRQDLPYGNMVPFPMAGFSSLPLAYGTARNDLDTTAPGADLSGPLRSNYWVQSITQNHENAHLSRFYSSQYWIKQMDAFETTVESGSNSSLYFNCTNPFTSTADGAKNDRKLAVFSISIDNEHNKALAEEELQS